MSILIRLISILLIIVVLQVYLDETFEHYKWNGKAVMQNPHALASVNDNLQQNHDHLWILSAVNGFVKSIFLPAIPPGISAYVVLSDLILPSGSRLNYCNSCYSRIYHC